jgi:hypothetical protein
MKKAQFSDAEAVAAANEFSTYMAPRTVMAGGKNGDVTLYGENPNVRKPPKINIEDEEEDINGLLQELSA